MGKRQAVVEAPGFDEATKQDHAVNDEREDHPRNDHGMHADRQRPGQGDMRAAIALAGDGGKVLA
ncbi:hypothetical protein D3C80_1216510 [compost metagenome]